MKKHGTQWTDVSGEMSKSGSDTATLDTEIAQMHKNIDSLQQELDSLYDQRTALKVS